MIGIWCVNLLGLYIPAVSMCTVHTYRYLGTQFSMCCCVQVVFGFVELELFPDVLTHQSRKRVFGPAFRFLSKAQLGSLLLVIWSCPFRKKDPMRLIGTSFAVPPSPSFPSFLFLQLPRCADASSFVGRAATYVLLCTYVPRHLE